MTELHPRSMILLVCVLLLAALRPAGADNAAPAKPAPTVKPGPAAPAPGLRSMTPAAKQTAAQLAKADGHYSQFLAAVKSAKLDGWLSGKTKYTWLMPTDNAFHSLPAGAQLALFKPQNHDLLAQLVKFHILVGMQPAADLAPLHSIKTIQGESLAVKADLASVTTLGPAKVNGDPTAASNGLIYQLDTVLIPASVAKALTAQGYTVTASSQQARSGSMSLTTGNSGAPSGQ